MLYFNRIVIPERIDITKTSASKKCNISDYWWYFLNYSCKFQPNVCNRYHDLLVISINLFDIAILTIKDFH